VSFLISRRRELEIIILEVAVDRLQNRMNAQLLWFVPCQGVQLLLQGSCNQGYWIISFCIWRLKRTQDLQRICPRIVFGEGVCTFSD
jgi:hypothetical protein